MSLHLLSDGTTFAYSNIENPKVCYLHGWGRDSQDFLDIIELYPGLAIDLPGFGKTKPFEFSMNPFEYANYLDKILPKEITTIVGHSFGGRVAVHMSLIRKIENLVLIGVPLISSNSNKKSLLSYISEKYLADIKIGKAFLLIDQSFEGYQTSWLWDFFHTHCKQYDVPPSSIIYVTGNMIADETYEKFCYENDIQDKMNPLFLSNLKVLTYAKLVQT